MGGSSGRRSEDGRVRGMEERGGRGQISRIRGEKGFRKEKERHIKKGYTKTKTEMIENVYES